MLDTVFKVALGLIGAAIVLVFIGAASSQVFAAYFREKNKHLKETLKLTEDGFAEEKPSKRK